MTMLDDLRSNRRLRIGVVAIIAILVVYGLLEWRDHLAAAKADHRRLLSQLARVSQYSALPAGAAVWQARAVEADRALEQARAQLWRNKSTGLAQAQVQDWLNSLLRQVDAKQFSLRVAEPETALETESLTARLPAEFKSLMPLRARVEFNSDPTALLGILAAMNDSPQKISVDILNVKGFKTEMALTFWFELDVGGAG